MPPEAEPALAAEFPVATEEEWLALVDKVLKGAPLSRLESTTPAGLAIHPLYTRAGDPVSPEAVGKVGAPPFTRGSAPSADEDAVAWGVRALIDAADPSGASKLALRELERGSTQLLIRPDAAFRAGVAPGEPGYERLGGRDGVSIISTDDLRAALEGVLLDLAPVHIDSGSQFSVAADMLLDVLTEAGVDATQASGGLGADPIGYLAGTGRLPQGLDAALQELAALAGRLAGSHPGIRAVSVDTSAYVEAGASEVQELAVMLATGAAYLRAISESGLSVDAACRQIEVTLSVDADVFNGVAKLRAARRVWSAMVSACGATGTAGEMKLHARTTARMMTKRDPWVNLLRVTAAAFAAGIGGAASVSAATFDSELGEPAELGRRMARNTQLLLQEESNLGKVADPMGGSWFIESLTDQIAVAAWGLFQELEASGGMPAVLIDGSIAERIAAVRDERFARVARRADAITGVSEFPDINETSESRPVRDLAGVSARAASARSAGTKSPGYSLGVATECAPLVAVRWAQQFETLRDRSDAQLAVAGSRPTVFLANIGPVAVHTARATFAKNFFESGGIAAVTSEQGASSGFEASKDGAAAAASDFNASGARLACICSSDAVYAEQAGAFAAALAGSGATVYLAGNPGENREQWSSDGVGEFIHVGVNVLDVLERAHDLLGTPAEPEVSE